MQTYGNSLIRGFASFVSGLNSVGTALILAIVLMINFDVFMRFVFDMPIAGVTELVELSIGAIVFLQLPDAIRAGRLTRSDGLFRKLQKKHPQIGHVLGAVFDLAGALVFAIIIMGSIPRFEDAWERGYYAGNKGIFVVPVWPVRLILVIGAATVVLVFLGMVYKNLAALKNTSGEKS